jgi:hypothetical protein
MSFVLLLSEIGGAKERFFLPKILRYKVALKLLLFPAHLPFFVLRSKTLCTIPAVQSHLLMHNRRLGANEGLQTALRERDGEKNRKFVTC